MIHLQKLQEFSLHLCKPLKKPSRSRKCGFSFKNIYWWSFKTIPSLPNTGSEGLWGRFFGVQIPTHMVFGRLGYMYKVIMCSWNPGVGVCQFAFEKNLNNWRNPGHHQGTIPVMEIRARWLWWTPHVILYFGAFLKTLFKMRSCFHAKQIFSCGSAYLKLPLTIQTELPFVIQSSRENTRVPFFYLRTVLHLVQKHHNSGCCRTTSPNQWQHWRNTIAVRTKNKKTTNFDETALNGSESIKKNNHAIGPIIFSHTVLMRKKLKKWGGFPGKFVTSMKWNKWYDEENSWLSGSDLGAPYVKLIPQLFFFPRSDFFVAYLPMNLNFRITLW